MDKAEYKIKLEQINACAGKGDFQGAAGAADTIDWRRVKSVRTLCMVSEIYEANKRYEDSMEILRYAYRRSPQSKTVLYRLTESSLRVGNIADAKKFFEEFEQAAPHDTSRYVLKYKLLRAEKAPYEDQIAVLKEYKEREYTERWAYELARLYKKNGQKQRCIEECDDMILWFAEGRYVTKAMELKMQLTPLTESQKARYESRLAAAKEAKEQEERLRKEAETASDIAAEEDEAREDKTAFSEAESEEAEEVTGSVSTVEMIEKMNAAADASLQVARYESRMPNVKPTVRQSISGRNVGGNEMQDQLASSIRAVFSGIRTQQENSFEEPARNVTQRGLREAEAAPVTISEEEDADLAELFAETENSIAQTVQEATSDNGETVYKESGAGSREAFEPENEQADGISAIAGSQDIGESSGEAEAEAGKSTEDEPDVVFVERDGIIEISASGKAGFADEGVAEDAAEIIDYAEDASLADESAATDAAENIDYVESVAGLTEETSAADAAKDIDYAETDYADAAAGLSDESSVADAAENIDYVESLADLVDESAAENIDYVESVMGLADETSEANAAKDIDYAETDYADAAAGLSDESPVADAAQNIDYVESVAGLADETPVEEESKEFSSAESEADTDYTEAAADLADKSLGTGASQDIDSAEVAANFTDESTAYDAARGHDSTEAVPVLADESSAEDAAAEAEKEYAAETSADSLTGRETDESLGLTREFNFSKELDKIRGIGTEEDGEPDQAAADVRDAESRIPDPEAAAARIVAEAGRSQGSWRDSRDSGEEAAHKTQSEDAPKTDRAEKNSSIIEHLLDEPDMIDRMDVVPRLFDETERKLFSYFSSIPGIGEQVSIAIADIHNNSGDRTSKSGNVIIVGRRGSGKTKLADSLILAVCKDLNITAAKTAKIIASDFNQKDAAAIVKKMAGGFLIIEGAGELAADTVDKLNRAMEFRTDDMVVILEDEKQDMKDLLERYPEFAAKFTSKITIPVFTNDELVTFGKTYAQENGYAFDELATLALYTMIGENQKNTEPVTVSMVRDMVDKAIAKSKSRIFPIFGKTQVGADGRVILREKDFAF